MTKSELKELVMESINEYMEEQTLNEEIERLDVEYANESVESLLEFDLKDSLGKVVEKVKAAIGKFIKKVEGLLKKIGSAAKGAATAAKGKLSALLSKAKGLLSKITGAKSEKEIADVKDDLSAMNAELSQVEEQYNAVFAGQYEDEAS